MINLLDPVDKKELHAARRNTIWSRYTFLTIALLVAVNIILGLTFFYIQSQADVYRERIAANEVLSNQQYKGTKEKAESFRKELATAKTILENETSYSTVIVDIARAIPSGCIVSSLTLGKDSFGAVQSISFSCKDPADILRLKSALEKNSDLFGDVNIVSTSTAVASEENPYPVSVTMSFILKKPASGNGAGS